MKKIYEKMGCEWTDTTEKEMRVWIKENAKHKYGTHSYSLNVLFSSSLFYIFFSLLLSLSPFEFSLFSFSLSHSLSAFCISDFSLFLFFPKDFGLSKESLAEDFSEYVQFLNSISHD